MHIQHLSSREAQVRCTVISVAFTVFKWREGFLLQAPISLVEGACLVYICQKCQGVSCPAQCPTNDGQELEHKCSISSPLGWNNSEVCSAVSPRGPQWNSAAVADKVNFSATSLKSPASHSLSHFPIPLSVYPGIISLHSNPHLRACFWRIPT